MTAESLIIGMVIVFLIYKLVEIYLAVRRFKEIVRTVNDRVEEEVRRATIRVTVEKHHDWYYLFNEATGEFVAQGKDMAELKQRCDQRFPQSLVVADEQVLVKAGLKQSN